MTAAAQLVREALDGRRAGAASPCSAAPAARTRTPSPGHGSPTPSTSRTATPSSPTACRPSCSPCRGRRSTRPTRASTVVLLGPDLKEELPGPLPAPAPRRRAAQGQAARARPGGHRAHARTPGAACASRPAPSTPSQPRSPTTRSPTSSRAGPVVVVAGRANLAESGEAAAAALRAVLDACPGATVLPALRRGNVVGALQLGLTPHDDGLDAAGILTAAAEGRVDLLVLLGADPLADCPGRRPRPPRPRRRPPGHRRRHVPHRLGGRRRRRARRRRVRREVGHDDEPRGPGHRRSARRCRSPARRGRTG